MYVPFNNAVCGILCGQLFENTLQCDFKTTYMTDSSSIPVQVQDYMLIYVQDFCAFSKLRKYWVWIRSRLHANISHRTWNKIKKVHQLSLGIFRLSEAVLLMTPFSMIEWFKNIPKTASELCAQPLKCLSPYTDTANKLRWCDCNVSILCRTERYE